jgi:sulfatase maturation enzyme AslB (radical SAM superfamily)
MVDGFPENVAQFKYLGTMVTNQILIQEEIMRRFTQLGQCLLPISFESFVFCSAV